METRKTLRLEQVLNEDLTAIAEENNTSVNQIINEALKMYRDSHYLKGKASVIPEEIQAAVRAEMELISTRDMNKIRTILSSLAINVHVIQRVLAGELELSASDLVQYRQEAVEILQENNRVFDLKEFIE